MPDIFSFSHEFLISLAQIIGVNIVLSGDNAVVIALAARGLPPQQQQKAVAWGSGAAIIMRIVLTITAVALLSMPYLKLVGSVLLVYIGIHLLNSDEEGEGEVASADNMGTAIRTILIADLAMSLDNVLAVAAAANGKFFLLVIGLAISIPLVIFGARMLLTLMERFPIIITLGAVLLGYVAGEMAVTDPAIADWVDTHFHSLHEIVPVGCALLVLFVGKWLGKRKLALKNEEGAGS